jgi:hypothetical protein
MDNRELDAQVAEKVMGLRIENGWNFVTRQIPCPDNKPGCLVIHHEDVPVRPPAYSTDIAAAWLVVEKMEELGFRVDIESGWENLREYRAYKVRFYKPHYLEDAQSEHAPLAICKAALKAVGK